MRKGNFVVIEGPDAAGKTTQNLLLADKLTALGIANIMTREPGGTAIGNQIRTVLHNTTNTEMTAVTEFLLYSASRFQHLQQIVRPVLSKGITVLMDRFWPSSIAYQGYGQGLPIETLINITKWVCADLLEPDLIVYIDLEPAAALKRLENRVERGGVSNRLDQEEQQFHERVRNGYLELIQKFPDLFRRFDGEQPIAILHEEITSTVLEKIRL